jgi:hypothetical protein
VLHDNLTLVRPIMGLLATDGGRTTSVDGEFEVEDRKLNAARIEAVPMGFDDGDDGRAGGRVNSRTDNKVIGEFGEVPSAVPKVKIGAIVGERGRGMTNRTSVLLKKKDAIVNIVAVVHGNVAIDRLRAPELRGNVDDERRSNRARIKMIIKIGDAGGRENGEWERRRNNDRVDASRGGRKVWKERRRGKRRRGIGVIIGRKGTKRNEGRDFLGARKKGRGRNKVKRVGGTSKEGGIGE